MDEIEKLWAQYGRLQAQREISALQHRQATEKAQQLYQRIMALEAKAKNARDEKQ